MTRNRNSDRHWLFLGSCSLDSAWSHYTSYHHRCSHDFICVLYIIMRCKIKSLFSQQATVYMYKHVFRVVALCLRLVFRNRCWMDWKRSFAIVHLWTAGPYASKFKTWLISDQRIGFITFEWVVLLFNVSAWPTFSCTWPKIRSQPIMGEVQYSDQLVNRSALY